MSESKTLIPASNSVETGLKMVKNASIFQERGVYFIRHYQTIIFAFNTESGLCEANWNCSQTSNRQIRNAIVFFNVKSDNIVDVSDGSKWTYSGEFSYWKLPFCFNSDSLIDVLDIVQIIDTIVNN